MTVTSLVGCGVNRENLYDPTNDEIVLPDFFFIEENELYYEKSLMMDFMLQEITTAYCRKFNLDEDQIARSRENGLLEDFDKITIRLRGDYYVLEG